MTTMTFDRLAYVDRLKAAGFNEPQTRALADGLDQALREEVATKSDVAALRNEIDLLRVEVKSDLGTLRSELRGELSGVRGELSEFRGELNGVRGDLNGFKGELSGFKGELSGLKGELSGLKGELLAAMKADKVDLLKWVVMLIVGQTAVFTALKLLGR
ncbi:MAG: hypothetical protein ACOY4R_06355 [Pseudomonadota bacterium]